MINKIEDDRGSTTIMEYKMINKINELVEMVNGLMEADVFLMERIAWVADRKTSESADAKGQELLPCPFCGCPAYVSPLISGGYMARCTACHTSQRKETNRRAAVERWNRRTEVQE